MEGYAYIAYKYYTILYKGLEHLWILVLWEGSGTHPPWIPRDDYTSTYHTV